MKEQLIATYIPLLAELVKVDKGILDALILQIGFVLLEKSIAGFGILGFRHGVFEKRLFQRVKCD